jgi:hypothetical protein
VLAEQIDRRGLAGAPQALELRQRRRRRRAGDELAGHEPDVAPRGGRGDRRADGSSSAMPRPSPSARGISTSREVLVEMAQHVRVVPAGGNDVDEAEELRLEARMRERPIENPPAPAPQMEEARAFRGAGLRDAARERADFVLQVVGHRCRHYGPRRRNWDAQPRVVVDPPDSQFRPDRAS